MENMTENLTYFPQPLPVTACCRYDLKHKQKKSFVYFFNGTEENNGIGITVLK
jgi:hypothetical protein